MSGPTTLRYAAKALIVEPDPASGRERILCLHKQGDIGAYYVLPGGGQGAGELLPQALERECREELGARVEVGGLRFVQEYIGDNHEFRGVHGGRHFVNVYFACRLLEPPGTLPLQPDAGQVGWAWLDLDALAALPFYPRVLAGKLAGAAGGAPGGEQCSYLGDSV